MTNFESLTNAEINRWAAERDGFDEFYWSESLKCFGATRNGNTVRDGHHLPRYATSADAALALLERWGLEWQRAWRWGNNGESRVRYSYVTVHFKGEYPSQDVWRSFGTPKTVDVKFPRALLNAACAAKEAQDARG